MMIVGFIVVALALGVGVFALLQFLKLKRINETPLVKSGETQGKASPKGLISVEGRVETNQPLIAPCSGKHCLYYEIQVHQHWEEQVKTENGMKTKKGKNSVHTEKKGSQFQVNDGSGPVLVDASEGVQAKMEKSFNGKGGAYGTISFGNYTINVGSIGGKRYATGTSCTEKIVPVDGEVFVMGQLAGNTIKRKDGMGGKLVIAKEGSEKLVKSTKRNTVLSAVGAVLLLPTGGTMAAISDAPSLSAGGSCGEMVNDIAEPCLGRQSSASPVELTWTVTEPGEYEFTTVGTGTDLTYRLWPSVTVKDAAGAPVLTYAMGGGQPAVGTGTFAA
ncbi:MAG: GIDE domain-containing protein, partial [Myxococcota bacterium]